MKMFYGDIPVNSMKIKHYEISTQDCTAIPSDLQSGVTCVSKGKKITGTGKTFEFAFYGLFKTNETVYVPNNINVVEITSIEYPVQHVIALSEMKSTDFTIAKVVGNIIINGTSYPITVQAVDNFMTVSCDETVDLEIFYGKDNYIWQ